jgi:hypothetical protein
MPRSGFTNLEHPYSVMGTCATRPIYCFALPVSALLAVEFPDRAIALFAECGCKQSHL